MKTLKGLRNKSNSNIDPAVDGSSSVDSTPNISVTSVEGSGSLANAKEKLKDEKKKEKEREKEEKAQAKAAKEREKDEKKKNKEPGSSKKDKIKNIVTLGQSGSAEKKEKRKSLTFKSDDPQLLKAASTTAVSTDADGSTTGSISGQVTPREGGSVVQHSQSATALPGVGVHTDGSQISANNTPTKTSQEKPEKSKFGKMIGAPINLIETGVGKGVKGAQTVASGTVGAVGTVASGTAGVVGTVASGTAGAVGSVASGTVGVVGSAVPKLHKSSTTIGANHTESSESAKPVNTEPRPAVPPVVLKSNAQAVPLKEWLKDQLLGIAHLALVTVLCWILGRLGFSIVWTLLLLSAAYYLEKRWRIRAAERSFALMEMQKRKKRSHFAEPVNWLQIIIDSWWPIATPSINSQITAVIQKILSENISKGGPVGGIALESFTLGRITPQITSIKGIPEYPLDLLGGDASKSTGDLNAALEAAKKKRADPYAFTTITNLDIDIDFPSEISTKVVLKIGLATVPIIVEKVYLAGRLRVELRIDDDPTSAKMPFLKVVSLAFKKPPELRFAIRTLMSLDIMDLPGLESKLHELLMTSLTEKLVLPAEIRIPLSESGKDYVMGIKQKNMNAGDRSKELKKQVDADKKKQKQDDKLAKKVEQGTRNSEVEEEITRLKQLGKDRAREAILKNLGGEEADTAVAYTLKVNVIEGKNLMALDAGGTSDPYVILKNNKVVRTTKVKKRTCNPVWNQILEFELPKDFDISSNVLEIQVMDKDVIGSDDSLGASVLDLGDMKERADKEGKDVWVDLKGVAHGKLHIELNLYEN